MCDGCETVPKTNMRDPDRGPHEARPQGMVTDSKVMRPPAWQILQNLARGFREKAEQYEALAKIAGILEPGTPAEVAMFQLALRGAQ